MDIKQQSITGYLTEGTGYRKLAAKYGVSRTTINKWVMIQQGISISSSAHFVTYVLRHV